MRISEKYLDMAKKWRVRVTLDDGSSIFLKFQKEPKDEEVFKQANEYLFRQKEQEKQIEEEADKRELIDDISLKELQTKLGVKGGTSK